MEEVNPFIPRLRPTPRSEELYGPRSLTLQAFSFSCMGKEKWEYSDKIILPQDALFLKIQFPAFFHLHNPKKSDDPERKQLCGVLEFSAQQGAAYLPDWMMQNLDLQEGGEVTVSAYAPPQKGVFCCFQPETSAFMKCLKEMSPKHFLESALTHFSVLRKNERIVVSLNGNKYALHVLNTKPANTISIVGTVDLEVQFAPALDTPEGEMAKVAGGVPLSGLDMSESRPVPSGVAVEEEDTTYQKAVAMSLQESKDKTPNPLPLNIPSSKNPVFSPSSPNSSFRINLTPDKSDQKGYLSFPVSSTEPVIQGNKSEDLVQDDNVDPSNSGVCRNCGRSILLSNMALHELRCGRERLKKKEKASREQEPVLMSCLCGARVEASQIAVHQTSQCPMRVIACDMCQVNMRANQLETHQVVCGDTKTTCATCGLDILRRDKASHSDKDTGDCRPECNGCKDRVLARLMAEHLAQQCPARIVTCPWCHLQFKFEQMKEHEGYCGNRTEQCEKCSRYIKLKDMNLHNDTNCALPLAPLAPPNVPTPMQPDNVDPFSMLNARRNINNMSSREDRGFHIQRDPVQEAMLRNVGLGLSSNLASLADSLTPVSNGSSLSHHGRPSRSGSDHNAPSAFIGGRRRPENFENAHRNAEITFDRLMGANPLVEAASRTSVTNPSHPPNPVLPLQPASNPVTTPVNPNDIADNLERLSETELKELLERLDATHSKTSNPPPPVNIPPLISNQPRPIVSSNDSALSRGPGRASSARNELLQDYRPSSRVPRPAIRRPLADLLPATRQDGGPEPLHICAFCRGAFADWEQYQLHVLTECQHNPEIPKANTTIPAATPPQSLVSAEYNQERPAGIASFPSVDQIQARHRTGSLVSPSYNRVSYNIPPTSLPWPTSSAVDISSFLQPRSTPRPNLSSHEDEIQRRRNQDDNEPAINPVRRHTLDSDLIGSLRSSYSQHDSKSNRRAEPQFSRDSTLRPRFTDIDATQKLTMNGFLDKEIALILHRIEDLRLSPDKASEYVDQQIEDHRATQRPQSLSSMSSSSVPYLPVRSLPSAPAQNSVSLSRSVATTPGILSRSGSGGSGLGPTSLSRTGSGTGRGTADIGTSTLSRTGSGEGLSNRVRLHVSPSISSSSTASFLTRVPSGSQAATEPLDSNDLPPTVSLMDTLLQNSGTIDQRVRSRLSGNRDLLGRDR